MIEEEINEEIRDDLLETLLTDLDDMIMDGKRNGLVSAGLVGKTIVKCDDQKCETCPNESFECQKLICSGGHVCVWE